MSAYVFLPNCTADIDFMTSHFVFNKNGHHDHYLAFLVTNKSDVNPDEIVVIYPYTFNVVARLYRSESNYFSPESASKRLFPNDLVITDKFDGAEAGPFIYNDTRVQGFRYIGFNFDKVNYHGWLGTSQSVERVEVPAEVLRDNEPSYGFSIFRLKSGLNLEKNFPQWVFLRFRVDIHMKGAINKLFQGLMDNLSYSHSIDVPYMIKKKLKQLIETKKGSSLDEIVEAAQQLEITLANLHIETSLVLIKKYVLYFLFNEVEYKNIAGQFRGDPVQADKLPATETIYYRLQLDNLRDTQEGNLVVLHTEPFRLWRFLRIIKLVPIPN